MKCDSVSDRESEATAGQAEIVRALIHSWTEMQDGAEQRETIDTLIKGLDSERLSGQKLIPEKNKGRSW